MSLRMILRLCLGAAAITAMLVVGAVLAAPQTVAQQKAQTSDQVFKNIQVLKGIPVDDFMGTMGLMSAAIGYDCSECHIGAGTEKVNWPTTTDERLSRAKWSRWLPRSIGTISRDGRS